MEQLEAVSPDQETVYAERHDANIDQEALTNEIAAVLNSHSAENCSDTPDFILAHFLMRCFCAWNWAVQRREQWHGRPNRLEATDGAHEPNPAEKLIGEKASVEAEQPTTVESATPLTPILEALVTNEEEQLKLNAGFLEELSRLTKIVEEHIGEPSQPKPGDWQCRNPQCQMVFVPQYWTGRDSASSSSAVTPICPKCGSNATNPVLIADVVEHTGEAEIATSAIDETDPVRRFLLQERTNWDCDSEGEQMIDRLIAEYDEWRIANKPVEVAPSERMVSVEEMREFLKTFFTAKEWFEAEPRFNARFGG